MNRLVYFPVPGRAEAIRIALTLSNLEWEDIEVDGAKYTEMKNNGELPWKMLPVLQTPNGTIAESSAILRFVGMHAGLVSQDHYQAAKADEFMDGMGPLARVLDTTFAVSDNDELIRLRTKLFSKGGDGANNLQLLDDKVAESKTGWAAGTDELSIADLKLFTELFGLFSGNYDGIEASMISGYSNLMAYHEKVANEPRIQEYYNDITEDNIRWTYLPGAFN